jgi:pepF/M3 family oligoendopeptidase
MEKLPPWSLSNVFPGLDSPEFKRAVTRCDKLIKAQEAFLRQHNVRSGAKKKLSTAAMRAIVAGHIERTNSLARAYGTLRSYVFSFVATDSNNQQARKIMSELEPLGVRLEQSGMRFSGWLGEQATAIPGLAKAKGTLADHAFFLQETVEQSRYQMSDQEEDLAAELSLSGVSAWSKLQGTIVSQLSVPFERNGKTETISMPELINIQQHDADSEVRRSAYDAEFAAWKTVEEPLAAAMNGVKGATAVLNKKRGRKDAVHSAIDAARIDRKTLDAMLGAMRDSFPQFRRYLKVKAKRLGHSGALPWWDLMAPVSNTERHFSWSDARVFVLDNFATFSPRLHAMSKRAFDQNWIDAEQRQGKRAGAFCMDVPAVDESRILCNFDGSLDQVSTIAHELGHAFHNECQVGRPFLQTVTPMTLAETASIFCENIIIDAALKTASNSAEKLSILETDLIGKTQVIVDITSRYLFETEVFNRRAQAELSADELSDLMLKCQKETYGDGLDERYMHKYMWTWKPHYYYGGLSFYNFPYAFGLLFSLGLYAIYKQRGAAFVPDYEALLASTGMADAATLAQRFKIDIRKKSFWQGSLNLIGARIDEYCAL